MDHETGEDNHPSPSTIGRFWARWRRRSMGVGSPSRPIAVRSATGLHNCHRSKRFSFAARSLRVPYEPFTMKPRARLNHMLWRCVLYWAATTHQQRRAIFPPWEIVPSGGELRRPGRDNTHVWVKRHSSKLFPLDGEIRNSSVENLKQR